MFTQTVEYALRAVVFLGQQSPAARTTEQIATATQVPRSYLAKVLQSLTHAGIVKSQRGIGGGVSLARDAEALTILEIVNCVDPIQRIKTCPLGLDAHGTHLCPLHRRMDDALATMEQAFGSTTLAEILAEPSRSVPLCSFPAESHDRDRPSQSTRVSRVISAPREAVYRAFLDPDALASWLPPETMTGRVHAFEPRAGGAFRMSLIYQNPKDSPGGKTSEDTDTVQGRFVELIPDERIVWITEFESQDPDFAGEMRITWSLADAEGGTEVSVLCEDIPKGIRPEDNEMGCRSSLQNLARYVE